MISFLLAGCFFIVKEDEKVKIYGSSKEIAMDTLNKLYGIKTEEAKEKTEVKLPEENIERIK
ncbi:MAG: hypothetical protein NTW64_03480 [Candidatus Omnitrophica bacterium]|nr:hypothetical protein [Candidatus Omnitrophota bacterium]